MDLAVNYILEQFSQKMRKFPLLISFLHFLDIQIFVDRDGSPAPEPSQPAAGVAGVHKGKTPFCNFYFAVRK